MGRKRLRDRHLPERVYLHHGAYYFVPKGGSWIRLGATLAEMYLALSNMEAEKGTVLVMHELFDRYLREVVPLKKPATQRSNQNSIQWLRPFFGQIRVLDVETVQVFQYREIRAASGVTAANRDLEVLSHCFSKAIEWGILGNDKHPMRGLRIKLATTPRDRYVTDDELDVFTGLCGEFLSAYLGLKMLTGLSKGDILSLRLSDITDEGIRYQRRKTTGRGAKPKVIKATPELLDALEAVRKIRPKGVSSIYLFATRDGQPYIKEDGKTSGFDSIWQRAMAKAVDAGVPRFTEHDLRAKVASETNLSHAQQLMDHTTAAITERVYRRAPVVVEPMANKNKRTSAKSSE